VSSSATRPIRIVVLTSLFPNSQQPRHGIFVEERLRGLLASGEVEARVIAPVPWFFSAHPSFGRYAEFAAVPRREVRHGVVIDHPRYLVIPKIGMTLAPIAMARAVERTLAALQADGFDFDLIDAHYFYPDGVAAARLARRFNRPFVVTARGHDINVIGSMPVPARQIRAAGKKAGALITVSAALARKMEQMGIDARKITTLRNGVDMQRFAPCDRSAARARIGVSGSVWICVGHLIEIKGMHLAVEALARVDGVTLLLVGNGPEETALRAQAGKLGVSARLRFVGTIAHEALVDYFNAADALIHAASVEGMPNVVLEALACGCAVIATRVGGIPEVIREARAGTLLPERSAQAIVDAWELMRETALPARAARREHAEQFSWDATTAGQLKIFRELVARRTSARVRGKEGTTAHSSG
jgi:teichuronic acid biosynthesis glycosyltransferase TuaC